MRRGPAGVGRGRPSHPRVRFSPDFGYSYGMSQSDDAEETVETPEPAEPIAPITNRFLFVDVASLRAKQLRRGSTPRIGGAPIAGLEASPGAEEFGRQSEPSRKLERVAMDEVAHGLIAWDLPGQHPDEDETT